MAVRKNGYYADPALAASFDNLASAFATPTGSDVLGYTKAGAEREKALRLKDLFDYARSTDYNQTTADRMGVAAGNYTPTQSFYAQDQNNTTALRGQDVTAKTGVDVANINNAGALARQDANPIIVADGATAYLPGRTAAVTGLPGMFRGNVTANEGQTITTPTGEVIRGAPKLPTDSQVIGAITAGLPAAEQRAVATKGISLAPIVGKDGNPTNVASIDAIGQTPHEKDTRQTQVANYKRPDGSEGSARLDKTTEQWVDTQSGAVLPQGIKTYTASLQGDAEKTGLGASTKNNIDQQLLDLALTESTSKQLRTMVANNPAVQGLSGKIRGTVQNVIQAGGEVGQLFNVNVAKLKEDIAAGRVDPDVAKKFNFDPNIPATAMLETLLTAQMAKVMNSDGRVSNKDFEIAKEMLGAGGLTGNTAQTLAALDQFDKIIADRRGKLAPVRPDAAKIGQTPAADAAPTPAPSTAAAPEVWERGPDGKLRRAQ